jgi:hypothetical protein
MADYDHGVLSLRDSSTVLLAGFHNSYKNMLREGRRNHGNRNQIEKNKDILGCRNNKQQ